MPTVFISRDLDADSPLRTWATERSVPLITRSLLTFEPVSFQPPPRADVWFFYSSRAVEFSIFAITQVQKLPKIGAMGGGTARALADAGFPVDFVGTGDPVAVAQQFMEFCPRGTVFFPRARQSRKSVQRLLTGDYRILDAICYDNVPVQDPAPVTADAYVFTSPLNAETYVRHHPPPATAAIIAIGPSTSQALARLGIAHTVAREPSEAELIRALETALPHSRT